MEFNTAVATWLEYMEAMGRAVPTIKSYRERTGWFGRMFGQRLVGDIAPAEADKWLLALRRQNVPWEGHSGKKAAVLGC